MTWLLMIFMAVPAGPDGRGGDDTAAASLLRRAFLVAKGLPGDTIVRHHRSQAIASITRAQAEAGDVQGAISSMGELGPLGGDEVPLPGSQLKIECLTSISRAQAKLGRRGDATILARQASELIGRPGDVPTIDSGMPYLLSRLASARIASGEAREGEAIRLDAIRAASRLRDESVTIEAIAAIALDQASGGDVQGALDLIDSELMGRGHRGVDQAGRVLAKISDARAGVGDFDGAGLSSRKIGDPFDRARALLEIARRRESRGQAREADELLESARRISEGIKSEQDRAIGLLAVYAALIERDNLPPAREILAGVERMIEGMDPVEQLVSLLALSMTSSKLRDFRDAERRLAEATRIVERFKDEKLKKWADSQIGYARSALLVYSGGDLPPGMRESEWVQTLAVEKALSEANRGELEAAIRTAAIFKDDPDRATNVERVFEALAKSGEAARATALAETLPHPLSKARALLGIARGINAPMARPDHRRP